MNSTPEATFAREALQTEIWISHPEDAIRQKLLERVTLLTDADAILAHSYVVATQAEKVRVSVEMLMRFLWVEPELAVEA